MHVQFKKHGLTREVKAGYSWTVLFFGPFPFAFRSQWGVFFAMFLAHFLSFGLSSIIMSFFANKVTARHLIENGWITEQTTTESWGYIKPEVTQ